MKVIKSALLGSRTIHASDDKEILGQIVTILREHRELIIERLMRDIRTYIDYKFNIRPTEKQIASVKDCLQKLKSSEVDLNYYKAIVLNVFDKSSIHLTNEPFYNEIDAWISVQFFVKESEMIAESD